MTSKRYMHKASFRKAASELGRKMAKARWDADRAKRDAEMPARVRELAAIEAENLPRNPGDMLGTLQWFNASTGKARRWIVRIGSRRDQITLESPQGKRTASHGWAWAMNCLRSAIVNER